MSTPYIVRQVDGRAIIPTPLMNGYSALSVPAYWQAMHFVSRNFARFAPYVCIDPKGKVAHKLDRFFRLRVSQYQTWKDFAATFWFHRYHWNKAFAHIKRTPTGEVIGIYNMHPEDVKPFRYTDDEDDKDQENWQQWYYVASRRAVYPAADVIHLKGLSCDGLDSYDTTVLHAETLRRAATICRFSAKYAERGTFISGAIEYPAGINKEEADEIADLVRKFKGAEATEDLIHLFGGAKLSNTTIAPQQSQLMEQMSYSAKDIARLKGLPPWFLFEFEDTKYNDNGEQMGDDLIRFHIGPELELAEDEFTVKLLTDAEQEQGYKIKFNVSALLRGDAETQEKIVIDSVGGPIRTTNEGRRLLDLSELDDPEADKLRTPAGAPKPEEADRASEPAAAVAEKGDDSAFSVLEPLINEVADSVDGKANKAFADADRKSPAERAAYLARFTERQADEVPERFRFLAPAIERLSGKRLDVVTLSRRYADELKHRADGGDQFRQLRDLVAEHISGAQGGDPEASADDEPADALVSKVQDLLKGSCDGRDG